MTVTLSQQNAATAWRDGRGEERGAAISGRLVDRDPRETICLLSDGAEAETKAAVADATAFSSVQSRSRNVNVAPARKCEISAAAFKG